MMNRRGAASPPAVAMARGLLLSPQSRITSNLLFATVSSASLSKPTIPFTLNHSHAPHSPRPLRFLCKCSNLSDPVHMSDCRDVFSRRMARAGLKPHHRIAIGVSGGPDSMALCVLTAGWKADARDDGGFVEGLLAIIVDHGLRAESKDEAELVNLRVSDMGIRCEVARCDWSDGRPKQGHLQEAARDIRYKIFQHVCIKHQIGVLLVAHHADDQAELFILRLSRNSGVLGLAGMAFVSQLFPIREAFNDHGILLVRPLLEFSKEDIYMICKGANQKWVEDPSNQSPLFARNRIRMSLRNSALCFKFELHALISACRETRSYVEQVSCHLINRAVTVMAQGCAVVDLEALNPSKVENVCLSKFVALVLQFISQRHRTIRGSASKLLLDYIRTFPCRTSLTAAGCYLCAAPGSKGTKVLVCCSVNSPLPSKMELLYVNPLEGEKQCTASVEEEIIANGKLYSDRLAPDGSDVHFLDAASGESVLSEARRLNVISESTFRNISLLQREEIEHFRSKTNTISDGVVKHEVGSESTFVDELLQRGQIGYFMNRFLVKWELCDKFGRVSVHSGEANCDGVMGEVCHHRCNGSCLVGRDMVAKVRPMVDADWLYLAKLSECRHLTRKDLETEITDPCLDFARLSAQRALLSLKSLPAAVRRGLPVLINPQGLLLSIPSIGFNHCPCLMVSAVFKPRVPLGGGHISFL